MDTLLYDAERRCMEVLWDCEPVNSTAFCRLCMDKLGWKKSTAFNMLRKLGDRGLLVNENAVVRALVSREQVQSQEAAALVERSYGGSVPALFAAFLRDRKLSHAELETLKALIEEAEV